MCGCMPKSQVLALQGAIQVPGCDTAPSAGALGSQNWQSEREALSVSGHLQQVAVESCPKQLLASWVLART